MSLQNVVSAPPTRPCSGYLSRIPLQSSGHNETSACLRVIPTLEYVIPPFMCTYIEYGGNLCTFEDSTYDVSITKCLRTSHGVVVSSHSGSNCPITWGFSNTSVRRKNFALYVFIICPDLRFWVYKYRFEYFGLLGDDSSSLAVETSYKSNTNRTLYKHGRRF
jgi:hypothetical protein